jgi:RHS repeat-associated protein
MTEEAISRSEAKGTLSYGLDPVGNRQSLLSTLTPITSQTASYNANDHVMANGYDSNGNTLTANGKSYAYDSMDRMTSFNGGSVKMVYDGDGNRVSKTAGGVTTQYLVDDLNPTGLPQVLEEIVGGVVQRTYQYGLERISQTQVTSGTTSYYGYDAHGDVRFLADSTSKVTDTYDYDAFGNIVGSTGTTPNVYRYQGEALDTETGLYYLRARYYDPVAGRFLNVDPMADEGEHPYTYAGADPVNGHDPTGQQEVIEFALTMWLVSAHAPPFPDLISCMGGIMFSGGNPVKLVAAMAACQSGRGPGKGKTGGNCRDGNCSCGTNPDYNPGVWNTPGLVHTNNCYTYSWGVPQAFPPVWTQPGGRSGKMVQKPLTCDKVKAAAVNDGYQYIGNSSCCPKGFHTVVLVVGNHIHEPNSVKDLGRDYHWYRQDFSGGWSSKHGSYYGVGGQVSDPFSDARSWGYDQPCGRMCAPDQLK